MFELRDYQSECINTILDSFLTLNSQLVQLPTGAGKTVILWYVLKYLNKRTLIIAPTRELTEQLEETGRLIVDPNLVYRKTKSYWSTTAQYLIMTVQAATFAQKGDALDNFNPNVLIVDEAHRSRSPSLENLIQRYVDKGVQVLGLTATPERLDGKSLLEVYEKLTYSITLIDLIDSGYLVDLECYKIKTKHKVDKMSYSSGDISSSVLCELNTDSRNVIILDTYQTRCHQKKTLVFCLNVAHAEKMATIFVENNIRAVAIHGGLGINKRRAILKMFREGEIDVLFNCQLLTEGFDEPSIEALILARPTKSKALYCQMIGRGVRPFHNKDKCLIYDLSDEIHNICNFNVLGGIPEGTLFEWKDGERLTKAVDRHRLSLNDMDYEYERFNLYDESTIKPPYAVISQKELLDFYNIPYLADITMPQAAYLIFKTMMMRKHGIDSQEYWKKWRRILPGSDTFERDIHEKQELCGL